MHLLYMCTPSTWKLVETFVSEMRFLGHQQNNKQRVSLFTSACGVCMYVGCVCVCVFVGVSLCMCVLPDDVIDLIHGLTEKYTPFLVFPEQISPFLGYRRGSISRILGRYLMYSRILG